MALSSERRSRSNDTKSACHSKQWDKLAITPSLCGKVQTVVRGKTFHSTVGGGPGLAQKVAEAKAAQP